MYQMSTIFTNEKQLYASLSMCQLGERFSTGGAWNVKNIYWGSRLSVTRGRELKKAIDKLCLVVLSTWESTNRQISKIKIKVLILYYRFLLRKCQNSTLVDLVWMSSDCIHMIWTLSTTIIWKDAPDTLYNKEIDWIAF